MFYQSYFTGEGILMHTRGRTRMLLVFLLGSQRLETSRISGSGKRTDSPRLNIDRDYRER